MQRVTSPKFGFLIDMDGVLYRGTALIPGADRFVNELRSRDIPFLFLTNNSQRTRRDVVARLTRFGLDVEEEHVFTSAMATARFLSQQKPRGTRSRSPRGIQPSQTPRPPKLSVTRSAVLLGR